MTVKPKPNADRDNLYGESHSHHVSNDRWLDKPHPQSKARPVYNPDAVDADHDMIVQEGTPFARPYHPRFTPNTPGPGPKLPPQKSIEGIPIETTFPIVTYPPFERGHQGVRKYLKAHPEYDDGEWKASYADVKADPDTQRVIAAAYRDLPEDGGAEADAAYAQFQKEIDQQYDFLIGELGVKHEVVPYDPYPTVEDMITDLRENNHLYTLATAATGSHIGELTDAENDKKRAVHDAFGHAASGRGFDRHGEEAAYQAHAAMFSALAQRAAMTDFRGQNATLIVYGERAKQKRALMPIEMQAIDFKAKPEGTKADMTAVSEFQDLLDVDTKARRRVSVSKVRYNPNATDPDHDLRVQEGTEFERPYKPHAPKVPKVKPGRASRVSMGASKPEAVNKIPTGKPGKPAKVSMATPRPQPVPHSSKVPIPGSADIAIDGRPDGAGTRHDPIAVGNDLDLAAKLISEGKSVRLEQPDQVSTLLEKLAEYATAWKAANEGKIDPKTGKPVKPPLYNLCNISVPGTNLFCTESKGIPRVEMPQFSGKVADDAPAAKFRREPGDPTSDSDVSKAFVDSLRNMGIDVSTKKMRASHLRATQDELDGFKVGGMMSALDKGVTLKGTVFVTRDGYVLDGHHRWAAVVGQDAADGTLGDNDVEVEMIDMDIGAALDFANAFTEAMGIPHAAAGNSKRGKEKKSLADLVAEKFGSDVRGYERKDAYDDGWDSHDHFGEAPSGLWLPWDAMPTIDLGEEVKAGGVDRSRGNAERLRRYWTHGEGAAKIGWGTPGDFKRCVALVERHMPGRAEGYCANRHKEATGGWPGHAPAEEAIHAAERAGKKVGKSDIDDEFTDAQGRPYDESHPDVQDILLAEDAAMKSWLDGNNDEPETKAINVGSIFDVTGWVRRLTKDSRSWFERIFTDYGARQQAKSRAMMDDIVQAVGDDANVDPIHDFDLALPQVQASLAQQVNRMADVDAVTFARVRDTLAEGEANGETMPQLAARVKQVFATSKARAMAIARTEVTSAANAAQLEAARVNGAKTKTWIAAHDPRTREAHRLADRQTVDINAHYLVPYPFVKGVPTGTFPMDHPGDPTAPPGLVVNCRCTQAYGFGLKYPGAVESDDWFKAHGM